MGEGSSQVLAQLKCRRRTGGERSHDSQDHQSMMHQQFSVTGSPLKGPTISLVTQPRRSRQPEGGRARGAHNQPCLPAMLREARGEKVVGRIRLVHFNRV